MSCHYDPSLKKRNSRPHPPDTVGDKLSNSNIAKRIENLKTEIDRSVSCCLSNYDDDKFPVADSERLLASHELEDDSLCSVCRDYVRDHPSDTIPVVNNNTLSKKSSDNSNSWTTVNTNDTNETNAASSGVENATLSLLKFNDDKWSQQNSDILSSSSHLQNVVNDFKSRTTKSINKILLRSDENEELIADKLKQRNEQIYSLRLEFETEITLMDNEIKYLENSKSRLGNAIEALLKPENIVKECLEKRSSRKHDEFDLIRNRVIDEFSIQLALIGEIKILYERLYKELELQMREDKTIKRRLEEEWSNKVQTNEIESINVSLSKNAVFTPCALSMPTKQATIEFWEQHTKQVLHEARRTRCRSSNMRTALNEILISAANDLNNQRKAVDITLSKKIEACTDIVRRLEQELQKTLKRLSEADQLKNDVEHAIRKLTLPIRKVTTRLDYRLKRPGVENCSDDVHDCLMMECHSANADLAALKCHWDEIEKMQHTLTEARIKLEKELRLKIDTLEDHRESSRLMNQYFPNVWALSGSKTFEEEQNSI